MRWLTFLICAVVVLTLEVTLAPLLQWHGARPQWLLMLAVFFALNGRSVDVLIGAWILGLLYELHTLPEYLGLFSLGFSLVALVVYGMREFLFREHPLTHFLVTFAACLAIQVVVDVHRMITFGNATGTLWEMGREALLTGLVTGLFAVPVHYVLLRMHRTLGILPIRTRRRRSNLPTRSISMHP
jgi:rod shape-determining protein MreD